MDCLAALLGTSLDFIAIAIGNVIFPKYVLNNVKKSDISIQCCFSRGMKGGGEGKVWKEGKRRGVRGMHLL
jgi:cyanate permease